VKELVGSFFGWFILTFPKFLPFAGATELHLSSAYASAHAGRNEKYNGRWVAGSFDR
jgi:hypothetical protein